MHPVSLPQLIPRERSSLTATTNSTHLLLHMLQGQRLRLRLALACRLAGPMAAAVNSTTNISDGIGISSSTVCAGGVIIICTTIVILLLPRCLLQALLHILQARMQLLLTARVRLLVALQLPLRLKVLALHAGDVCGQRQVKNLKGSWRGVLI